MRSRTVTVAAAIAATALLAGCSSESGSGTTIGPAVTTSATPTGTTAPTGTTGAAPAGTPSAPAGSASAPAGSGSAPGRAASIPDDAVLQPADWPGGKVTGGSEGVQRLGQTQPSPCQEKTAYPSDRHRKVARVVTLASDEPESGGVGETVVTYAPGRAAEAMAELRRALTTCRAGHPITLDQPGRRTYRVEAERFVGDDALLVRRVDRQTGLDREYSLYIAVVRVQDTLLTTTTELGEGTADVTVARKLAGLSAKRAACLRVSC